MNTFLPGNLGLLEAGVHILVFWALESSKMRTPRQSGSLRGGGEAGVHILVFWAIESSKMRTPRQSGSLRGGGTHFGILGP